MVGPTPITQVANLQLEVFSKFWPSSLRPILLNLMLDLPRVKQVELQIRDAKYFTQLIIVAIILLLLLLFIAALILFLTILILLALFKLL